MDNEQQETEVVESTQETTEVVPEVQPPPEDLAKKVQELEELHRQDTDRITRLKKEQRGQPPVQLANLEAEISYLKDAIKILGKQQGGGFGETGNYEQTLAQLDSDYQKKRSGIEAQANYQAHVFQSTETITETLREAGFDPESDNPEVIQLRQKWEETVKAGRPLDSIITEATKLATKTLKSALPSEEKIREKIKKEMQEEKKKSPSLKVDTGSAMGQGLSDDDFLKAYSKGDVDDHKRAKKIMDKRIKGG